MMAKIACQYSTEGRDPISEGIRAVQHSPLSLPYTHVDLVLPDGTLLGARSDGGVLIRQPNYATFMARAIVELNCTETQMEDFYRFAHTQVGKPYDYQAVFAFVAPTTTRDWKAGTAWFCSELSAAAKLWAGLLPEKLAAAVNKITPFDDYMISVSMASR